MSSDTSGPQRDQLVCYLIGLASDRIMVLPYFEVSLLVSLITMVLTAEIGCEV